MSDPGTPLPDDLPDDPDAALAAELVLRLLDPAEEAACRARADRDPAFAAEVARWQNDFSDLDGAFAPATPPARLHARVETEIFGRPPGRIARLWASTPLWRGLATAAVLAALAVGFFARPPRPGPEAAPLVATVAPTVGEVQLVALYEPETGLLRFTRVAGAAPPGRSLELWVLPEGETVPASLGVVPEADRFAVPVPTHYATQVGPGTAILVSDEVAGGSPSGQPEGQVLASGAIGAL